MPVISSLIPILAAAGSGSSGFGGGGGGGGGSSFSGGAGGAAGGSIGAGGVILIIVVALVFFAIVAIAGWRLRRRRAERVAAVTLASFEAAQDDDHFAADVVVAAAQNLFLAVQKAWSAGDIEALRSLVGPELMIEWERRLRDFAGKGWHNAVDVVSGPAVEYVGLVNREDDTQDRVCVRLSATLLDRVLTSDGREIERNGQTSASTLLREYWTLQRRADYWTLASIESDSEGTHNLAAEIVASPWSDTSALRDEALIEGAVADKALAGFATAELVDVELAADARAQALDLALVDGRFAPDVLEIAARRTVEAWVEAIDGEDVALRSLARPQAVAALLYGGDGSGGTRIVLRGARVTRIGIDQLEPGDETHPAQMTVGVTVRGRRYVEDRDTAAVLTGSKDSERTFSERWTFALSDDVQRPWQMVEVSEPVAG